MIVFEVEARDPGCPARSGLLSTPHGKVETPVFMPVGTQAAVRAMTPAQVAATGSRILLANSYHLALRPGPEIVKRAGGLHPFMGWERTLLTDSGGFQVFSLPGRQIERDGVRFRSEFDGTEIFLTPERVIEIEHALGADIIMPLDECTRHPATEKEAARGVENTVRWLGQCVRAHADGDQALFGIVQGSAFESQRRACADQLVALDLPGYAIGGVSVGEGFSELVRVVEMTAPLLPDAKPRYLMGVGLPADLLAAIECGMDMFDCVIPTRFARSATLFTRRGQIRISQRRYRRDDFPIDAACDCYACSHFSRAYVHHLYASNEILGTILGATHNVRFYQSMMEQARSAIRAGRYGAFKRAFLDAYSRDDGRSREPRRRRGRRG